MENAGQRKSPNGHQREISCDLGKPIHLPTRSHARRKLHWKDLANCSGNDSWLVVGNGSDPIEEMHEDCWNGAVELAQVKPYCVYYCR
jgi:hypothetical protein